MDIAFVIRTKLKVKWIYKNDVSGVRANGIGSGKGKNWSFKWRKYVAALS